MLQIAYIYNLNRGKGEEDSEFDGADLVARWTKSLKKYGLVRAIEFTDPYTVTRALTQLKKSAKHPILVVNMAEGTTGESREAFVPMLCESLGLTYTGSGPRALMVTLDKNWAKSEVARRGLMQVPQGVLVEGQKILAGLEEANSLRFPLIVKPNFEGSSKGIYSDSVVSNPATLSKKVRKLLAKYPGAVLVEEYIQGMDVFVPYLEIFRGAPGYAVANPEVLDPYQIVADPKILKMRQHFVYGYEAKTKFDHLISVQFPPALHPRVIEDIRSRCAKIYQALSIRDMGRIDLRVTPEGTPYFLELNAIPALGENGQFQEAAHRRARFDYDCIINAIVISALTRRLKR